MQRVCFLLKVRPDRLAEYRERHQAVWPDMLAALRATGWHNYSLFLRDDGLLVGYLETEDFQAALDGMARTDVNARWQAEMAPFFEDLDGRRPDQGLRTLTEVFHLD
ncbi:MAG TPA: L-rhamnose mutarotase [Streptosporangiaceae bacterium]|jgi:L-rhamnose mutarotase|nr:L-rhamnose mutarotase [Streptosporangiaceae bacterium]